MSIAFTKIAYCTKPLLDFRADCPIPFAKFCFPGFSGAGFPFRWAVFSDSRSCRLRTVSGDRPSIPGGTQRPDDFRPAVSALAAGPADCALSAATRHRYRAVPKGLTISGQLRAHWPSALPTAHCQRRHAVDTGRYPKVFRIQAGRVRVGCRPCRPARRLPAFAGGLRWQSGR